MSLDWYDGMGTITSEQRLLLRRMTDGDWRWVGQSANAMVAAAIEGRPPVASPRDGSDLGRCIVTRRVAPPHLHAAMDQMIAEWSERLEAERRRSGYGEWAGVPYAVKHADEHEGDVRTLLEARRTAKVPA